MSAPVYDPDFTDRFEGSSLLSSHASVQAWITRRLAWRWERLSQQVWGDADRTEATLLQVAHERALRVEREEEGRGATGGVVKERTGKVERQWKTPGANGAAAAADSDDYWRLSHYGQAYLDLRDVVCGAGPSWGIV